MYFERYQALIAPLAKGLAGKARPKRGKVNTLPTLT
jgi:hypothetical protein